MDRKPHPDRSRHRLLDRVCPAGACVIGGFLDRSPLNGGDPGWDADHNPWASGEAPGVHLVDEVAQHLLGDVEVGDHTVAQRADGLDV